MHNPELVGVVERVEKLAPDPKRVGYAELPAAAKHLPEARPVNKGRDEVDQPIPLTGIEQASNVGVVQL